jgi:hypothetical protein
MENFKHRPPADYLEEGEQLMHRVEELILASAFSLYDEIAAMSLNAKPLFEAFARQYQTAIIIFDGASVRELPLFEKLAKDTGFNIIESGYGTAALPSDTEYYIEQRMLGKRIAPSQLPSRKEITAMGITPYYYDSPTRVQNLGSMTGPFLLWSCFPDGTYRDLSAKFSSHFSGMMNLFDAVWKNTVMEIPSGYDILITSDHGYIFFGPGLESTFPTDAPRRLNNDRYKIFPEDEPLPDGLQELQVIGEKRTAMLRGRIKNRPQGPSGNKAYRHGGMSLMEMLTPWLVLKRD